MVQTKQTNRKQSTGRQGSPAKFPKKGKPSGKAAKHLAVATDDSQIGRVLLVRMIITTTITLLSARYELEENVDPLLEKLVSINVPRVFAGSTDQEWDPFVKFAITRGNMELFVARSRVPDFFEKFVKRRRWD